MCVDPVMALISHSGHPNTDTFLTPLWATRVPTIDTSVVRVHQMVSGLNCLGKQQKGNRKKKSQKGKKEKGKDETGREGEGERKTKHLEF